MALVQNKPLILSDESIRENLMFGNDRETSESSIRYQIEQMGAEFLFNEERFPNGLDTPIREESLGEVEKQKFALVRAALREPAILLIDGIGAGLPVRDQRDLLESVHKLSEGRTTIMLGVPTDKIVEIDRVIMLKGGRVEDQGRPEDLYRRNALFQKAWPALKT